MASDKLLFLIDAIYSAASDPSQWPYVAQQIQYAIGGHSVNLVLEDLSDARVNCVFSNGASESQVECYQNTIMTKDEITAIYDHVTPGMAFTTQEFFNVDALHSLFCYENFYENIGFANFNAGLFYRDDQRRGWLSVVRSESEPLYTPDEILLMKVLTPHLRRAFLLNVQLVEAQLNSKIALDSLEHIAAATLLLTNKGQVLQYNSQAEPYLHRPGIAANNITIRLPDTSANRRLHALIASYINSSACDQEGVVPFVEKGIQKTAMCFPWRSSEEQYDWLGQSACCIVFILSPSSDASQAELLQITFELSNGEVKVLRRLMEGMLVAEIAAMLYVTEAAVRFHIRNLLRKTQTRNQVELIAKVFETTSVRLK